MARRGEGNGVKRRGDGRVEERRDKAKGDFQLGYACQQKGVVD